MKNKHRIVENLTVFLISCRPAFCERQLEFISNWGAQIVILDGSSASTIQTPYRQKPNGVTYRHPSLAARFRFAADYCSTEFAMLMSDDDIYLRSGVSAALRHLNANPSLGCVIGPALGVSFDPWKPGYLGLYPTLDDRNSDLAGRIGWDSLSDSPQDRVFSLVFPYSSKLYYAICRGQVMKKVCQVLGQLPETPDDFFINISELIVELCTIALAPASSVNDLFVLRAEDARYENLVTPPLMRKNPMEFLTRASGQNHREALRHILYETLGDSIARDVMTAIFEIYPKNLQDSILYQNHYSFARHVRNHVRIFLLTLALQQERYRVTSILNPIFEIISKRFRKLYNTTETLTIFSSAGGVYDQSELTEVFSRLTAWHEARR